MTETEIQMLIEAVSQPSFNPVHVQPLLHIDKFVMVAISVAHLLYFET